MRPALLGRDCRIEDEAVIIGPVMLGDECTVGKGSWLARVVVPDRVRCPVVDGEAGVRTWPMFRCGQQGFDEAWDTADSDVAAFMELLLPQLVRCLRRAMD